MKKAWMIGLLALATMAFAAPAEAHHASASKITSGTFYVCYDNGVPRKNYNGTTKIHLHRKKPSRKHYRRHHCRKITLKLPTKVVQVPVPGPERVVYVQLPCNCPPVEPPTPCGENCDEPCGDDSCKHKGHKHKGGKC